MPTSCSTLDVFGPATCSISDDPNRDDVAELAVEALVNPKANGLTFEVKSDLAFSTLWEGTSNGDAVRDYGWVMVGIFLPSTHIVASRVLFGAEIREIVQIVSYFSPRRRPAAARGPPPLCFSRSTNDFRRHALGPGC